MKLKEEKKKKEEEKFFSVFSRSNLHEITPKSDDVVSLPAGMKRKAGFHSLVWEE